MAFSGRELESPNPIRINKSLFAPSVLAVGVLTFK